MTRRAAVATAVVAAAVAVPVAAVAAAGGSHAARPNGKLLFRKHCAACHTLKAAGARGTVGPNLDRMGPNRAVVARTVTRGSGRMPSFRRKLSKAQIDAIAVFVANAT